MLLMVDPGPLGLYKEIYNARALYTWLVHVSHALENIDYLTKTLPLIPSFIKEISIIIENLI